MRSFAMLAVTMLVAGCVSAPSATDTPAAVDVFPGSYVTSGAFSRVLNDGPHALLPGEVITLRSDLDGAAIQVGLVRPDVPEDARVPVIVEASPYFRPLVAGRLNETANSNIRAAFLIENFVPHGYAVAFVAERGTAGSGGCQEFDGPRTRADLDQAVTWLATQPWSTGNVGFVGFSSPGFAATMVASTGNPHVKTVVAAHAHGADWFGSFVRNGSAYALAPVHEPLFWQQALITRVNNRDDVPPERVTESAACEALAAGARDSVEAALVTGERNTWFDERDHRRELLANYRGSLFLVQGFRDHAAYPHTSFPWANAIADAGIPTKILAGQWRHTIPDGLVDRVEEGSGEPTNPTPRWDWAEILLRWFDRWLKEDASVDTGSRVQVADHAGAWRSEAEWPPRDASTFRFFLTPDGTLTSRPAAGVESTTLATNPTWAWPTRADAAEDLCPSCARFSTAPFDRETRLAGLPRPHLAVVPHATGGQLVAHLVLEDAGGATRLTGGVMDLRFADGGERARDVAPGEEIVARMELEPFDAIIPRGARLVLLVGQGGYGDGDVFYRSTYYTPSVRAGPVDLVAGGERSTLTMLAFDRAADSFFEPPTGGA